MTDYKQHCIKLLEILDTNWPQGLPTTWAKWADEARVALNEPEVEVQCQLNKESDYVHD